MNPIYLDHATGASAPTPSSQLLELLKPLYELVEADEASDFFLFGSSEEAAMALLFSIYLDMTRKSGKNHFVIAINSEAPLITAAKTLPELGALFELAHLNKEGVITVDAIAETLTARTAMVSIPSACGLTGVIQPVEAISALCRERGIVFHVDATHRVGKGEFSLGSSGADLLSFRGEPLGASMGSALFVAEKSPVRPLWRPTLNHAALKELSECAKKAKDTMYTMCTTVAYQRLCFEKKLAEQIEDATILFSDAQRVPHITAIRFAHIAAHLLHYRLYRKGIMATLGGGPFQEIKTLLRSASQTQSASALSFAFGADVTLKAVEAAADEIARIYKQLKSSQIAP